MVRVDLTRPSGRMLPDFAGLALESFDVRSQLLDPTRTKIAKFLSLLGPSRLRIGGTEKGIFWQADPNAPPPVWAKLVVRDADFVRLAKLTTRTGWRVDLGVGLAHYDPSNAAQEVADASRRLGHALASVEIGNEPDLYGSNGTRPAPYDYRAYRSEFEAYRAAIAAAAPGVPIAGPDLARSPVVTDWLDRFVSDEHSHLAFAAQHQYVTTACRGSKTSIGELLSTDVRLRTQRFVDELVALARRGRIPARLDETNSTSCGGQPGVSDRFASALWAVDYLLDSARRGVAGANLNGFLEACFGYTPLCSDANGRLHAQPVFYALLFVHAVGSGAFLPVSSKPDPKLSVYAVRRGNGSVAIVAVNRAAKNTSLAIEIAGTHTARLWSLTAPSLTSTGSVTFGGAAVTSAGTFTPGSVAVPRSVVGYRVNVPPGSAVLLTIPS